MIKNTKSLNQVEPTVAIIITEDTQIIYQYTLNFIEPLNKNQISRGICYSFDYCPGRLQGEKPV
jgi:hypothetical protein